MKRLSIFALASLFGLGAWAQTPVMKVIKQDGTIVTYKVANVKEVKFDDRVAPEINNQCAINEETYDIVAVRQVLLADGVRFEVLGSNISPLFDITMSQNAIGKTHDLAEVSPEEVTMKTGFLNADDPTTIKTGSLKVSFDKFKKNVTIAFTAEINEDDWAMAYTGPFEIAYDATQEMILAAEGEEGEALPILGALSVLPTETGMATQFAFAPVEGEDATALTAGEYAVWVSLSASALNAGGVSDLSTAEGYTIKVVRYSHETGKPVPAVTEGATAGSISYAAGADGKVYLKIDATIQDGSSLKAEYYGAPTAVTSLENLVPAQNEFIHSDADGNQLVKHSLTGVEYTDSGDKRKFFFMYEGADSTDNYGRTVPMMSLPQSMLQSGTYSLKDAVEGFEFNYGGVQLAKGQYRNEPDNGTLVVNFDEEGNIEVKLEVVNSYVVDYGWGSPTPGGDHSRVSIYFKGQLTAR